MLILSGDITGRGWVSRQLGRDSKLPTGLMTAGWGYWSPEVLLGDVTAGYQTRSIRRQETERLKVCGLWRSHHEESHSHEPREKECFLACLPNQV